jgi:hypothetical protein
VLHFLGSTTSITSRLRAREMSDDEDGGVVFFDNGTAAVADTELDEGDELSWEDKLVRPVYQL